MSDPACPKCKGRGEYMVQLFTSIAVEKCGCCNPVKVEPKQNIKYAFYSSLAAKEFGTVIWRTAEGVEVELTAVYDTPNGEGYMWGDKIFLCEVVDFVRRGRISMEIYHFFANGAE